MFTRASCGCVVIARPVLKEDGHKMSEHLVVVDCCSEMGDVTFQAKKMENWKVHQWAWATHPKNDRWDEPVPLDADETQRLINRVGAVLQAGYLAIANFRNELTIKRLASEA